MKSRVFLAMMVGIKTCDIQPLHCLSDNVLFISS
jgi:hypothetical protein